MTQSIPEKSDARSSRRTAGLLLFVVLVVDLVFMPHQVLSGDPGDWRQETRSILLHGRLWIDPAIVAAIPGDPGQYFVTNPADGHLYSKYGVVNALMAIPPILVVILMQQSGHMSADTFVLILNLWNVALSLLIAALLYEITGRYTTNQQRRFWYVLACLFATFLWYYLRAQSGEIYQVLFFALAYECALRGREQRRWMMLSWFFIGLLVLTRVFFGILIPVFASFFLFAGAARGGSLRRVLPAIVVPPAVIALLVLWINDVKFGSPWLSGYHQWRPEEHLLTGNWMDGVYGLLFSAHWSIFAYFPLLLLALAGTKRFAVEHRRDFVLILTAFLLTVGILAKIPTWRGEWAYGPRYLLFLLPVLSLPALQVDFGKMAWMASAAGLLFSVWLQVEVVRSDFWFGYRVQQPLEGYMDRDLVEYFLDRHEGIIIHDLSSHESDLDNTILLRGIRDKVSPQVYAEYRSALAQELRVTNLYWWPAAEDVR